MQGKAIELCVVCFNETIISLLMLVGRCDDYQLDASIYHFVEYLTIIPRVRVGYEMIDSQRDA